MCDVCERDREKQNREESRVESCILERVVVVPIKITANKTMYTSTSSTRKLFVFVKTCAANASKESRQTK